MRLRLRLRRLRLRLCGRGKMMKLFKKPEPSRIAPAGLHHFRRDGSRMHLRVDPDGSGVLVVNAASLIRLNPTGADCAWLILSGMEDPEGAARLARNYGIPRKKAFTDFEGFRKDLDAVIRGEKVVLDVEECPETDPSAPLRADLALTYRCNVACGHCYKGDRQVPEMDTDRWKEAINRLADAGIPQVVFTGGESILRDDLEDLVSHAESLGLITGLLTNGVGLADKSRAQALREAGLDYVQVTLESAVPAVHNDMVGADAWQNTVEGIRNSVDQGFHTVTNTTLCLDNHDQVLSIPSFVAGFGVNAAAFNTVICSGYTSLGEKSLEDSRLEALLLELRKECDRAGIRMLWYSPTEYCRIDPEQLDLGPRRCTAASMNICVEPDGTVLPCQSWFQGAGNILTDPWKEIWNSPLFRGIRNRDHLPAKCRECIEFTVCGGGCPLARGEGKD